MVETSNHESCKVDHEMIIITEHSSAIVDLDEILIGNHRQLSVISVVSDVTWKTNTTCMLISRGQLNSTCMLLSHGQLMNSTHCAHGGHLISFLTRLISTKDLNISHTTTDWQ